MYKRQVLFLFIFTIIFYYYFLLLFFRVFASTAIIPMQREAAEGESKNVSEAKKRVAENESSANMAEAAYHAEAHVHVSARDTVILSFFFFFPCITGLPAQSLEPLRRCDDAVCFSANKFGVEPGLGRRSKSRSGGTHGPPSSRQCSWHGQ